MGISDYIKDLLGLNFKSAIEKAGYEMMETFYKVLRSIERRIIRSAVSLLLIMIGLVFFSIAMVLFLVEYLGVSYAFSFFFIAAIFLLVGIIVKIIR